MAFGELPSPGQAAVEDLDARGYHLFPEPLDARAAAELHRALCATRGFDEGLFLSEAAFDANPQHRGVNPCPGRNLLERFADRLGFVEAAPQVQAALAAVLGPDYRLLDRKVVCGVPERSIPEWIRRRIAGNPVNNLGPYIRPEFRDVTYFYGIDFHQDLIDYKARAADFITLYVYLHPVTASDAPLFVLEESHSLGGAVFPHDLTRIGEGRWLYRNGAAGAVEARQVVLTGAAGFAAMWHACTLHGTQPDAADSERISLRYIFERGASPAAGIDRVNGRLRGPLSLADTRVDLAQDGAAAIKRNAVNQA